MNAITNNLANAQDVYAKAHDHSPRAVPGAAAEPAVGRRSFQLLTAAEVSLQAIIPALKRAQIADNATIGRRRADALREVQIAKRSAIKLVEQLAEAELRLSVEG